MNYTSAGLGLFLMFLAWRLWVVFEDVRKRGPNADAKGQL